MIDTYFDKSLGFAVNSETGGHCDITWPFRPEYGNMLGLVHGGIISTLMDVVAGRAALTLLAPNEWPVTVELQTHFMSQATGDLRLEAKVIRRGKRLIFVDAYARDAQETLVAKAACIFSIYRRPEPFWRPWLADGMS